MIQCIRQNSDLTFCSCQYIKLLMESSIHWWAKTLWQPAKYAVGYLHAVKTVQTHLGTHSTKTAKVSCSFRHQAIRSSSFWSKVEPQWIRLVCLVHLTCSIRLRSEEFGGQGNNLNSSSCCSKSFLNNASIVALCKILLKEATSTRSLMFR